MTDIELRYVLTRAAESAEVCVELGHPEHIRACVLDGLDGAGTRLALAGTLPAAKYLSRLQAEVAAKIEASPEQAADWRTPALKAAGDERFAAQRGA